MRSIPVVGSYISFFIFGGEFPGDVFISRLYTVHVLLVPGILLGLIGAHMLLLVYHKHTQFPGPGRTNNNVVGYPLMPVYMAKAGGYFFIVFGVTALMGALLQINPIWAYGPYDPSQVSAGSQPDWYMGWLDGALRIMPNWETHLWGFTVSWNVMIPGLGLIDVETIRSDGPRLIGNVAIEVELDPGDDGPPERGVLAGFENHAGRTVLGAEARALGRVHEDADAALLGQRPGRVDDPVHHGREVHVAGLEHGRPSVEATDLEQVREQRLEAVQLDLKQLGGPGGHRVEVLAGVVDDVGGHPDGGERRPQLVRDVGDEPLLDP